MASPGFEDDQFGEDAAAAWYAQAAEDDLDEDGEEEEEEEEEACEPDVPEDPDAAEDPYLAVDSDPYGAVAADPYGAAEDGAAAVAEAAPTTTTAAMITTPAEAPARPAAPKLSGSGSAASVATATALAAAFAVPPAGQASAGPKEGAASPAQARRSRRTAAAALPGEEVAPWRQPQRKVQKTHSQFISASLPPPAPPMPPVTPQTTPTAPPSQKLPPAAPVVTAPDPVPMQTEESMDQDSVVEQGPAENATDAEAAVAGEALDEMQEEVPDGEQDDGNVEDMSWDERVVVVRQGQVHIELQHRNPPMQDEALLRFCDWLDKQMPLVVENFPYVQKSGAYVDLSDNVIGPEGLDKLFRVLRDHRVPCVVMKAYRNVLDDSIVDTLIEYLYTQPESFPMHGIHISHNSITDKGASRLIRAAVQCGHYPRLTSRLPLWLRLESNHIVNPQKVVADCLADNFHVCLMKDGMCSRPDCNHMTDVHIQLPYFFNQKRIPKVQPPPPAGPAANGEPLSPEHQPDWMTLRSVPPAYVLTGIPAPKKQDFRPPAPRVGQPPQAQRKPQVPKAQGFMMPTQRLQRPPPPVMAATVEVPSWEADSPAMAAPVEVPSLEEDSLGPDISFGGASSGRPKLMNTTAKARGGSAPDMSFSWNSDMSPDDSSPGSFGNGWGGQGKGGAWRQGAGRSKGDGWGAVPQLGGWKSSWGSKDGGKRGDGKGKGRGKGGKGKGKKGDWQGPTLISKVKRDIQLAESDLQLGFQWRYVGEGSSPRITAVDPNSKVAQVAQAGACLLRVNGLDSAMFTEKQVTDMLKQRPISLRIGDQ
mmetsp:Transcript_27433/g.47606  ORF Transcript_27433/g.47606 Transcript_27433/m.47606 type:complete len:816 (-) Transcript_27433:91-2538(-)